MKCTQSWLLVTVALVAGCVTPAPLLVKQTVIVTQPPLPTYTRYPTYTPLNPLPTHTLYPTYTPVLRPTATPRPTQAASSTETPTLRPTHAPTNVPTPASTLLPAPILLEPESGARFLNKVRLKWSWYRRLGENEKFSIHLRSTNGPEQLDWRVTEDGLIDSGGTIHPLQGQLIVSGGTEYWVENRCRFEVNSGLGAIPPGEAFWRVAVVGEMSSEKWQISHSSEERLIVRTP